jgi:hypothetical protein
MKKLTLCLFITTVLGATDQKNYGCVAGVAPNGCIVGQTVICVDFRTNANNCGSCMSIWNL